MPPLLAHRPVTCTAEVEVVQVLPVVADRIPHLRHPDTTPLEPLPRIKVLLSLLILFYPFHLNTSYQTDMWYETRFNK